MNYSENGFAITAQCEGLRLQAYQDSGGIWTIGYGHTGKGVRPGLSITPDQAQVLLHGDLAAAEACVNRAVTVPLKQGQFDALVDFTFNTGCGSFLESTLLQYINQGMLNVVPGQLRRWVYADGKQLPGLVRRREAEVQLWESA